MGARKNYVSNVVSQIVQTSELSFALPDLGFGCQSRTIC